MHFTHPSDIMKIVGPTLVQPWREQSESATTLTRLHQLLDRLHRFRVLDPACGSGNFLYLAYRELKRLEVRIYERIDNEFPSRAEPGQVRLSFLSAQNFFGLDINPLAVEITKVAMMIARKLAIDELHIAEQPLPLDNLDRNFVAADALLMPDGQPAAWPPADGVIGNPPFIGAKLLKPQRGPDYVNTLRGAYPDVPGMADYCVYWFRKAHDLLATMPRCIVCSDTTKRPVFGFISCEIRPDHKLPVFAFPDDYSFGILPSHAHWLWFVTKCSKLKSDFNYTSSSVFDVPLAAVFWRWQPT